LAEMSIMQLATERMPLWVIKIPIDYFCNFGVYNLDLLFGETIMWKFSYQLPMDILSLGVYCRKIYEFQKQISYVYSVGCF